MTVWMCARGRAHCMCSLGLAGVSEGVVCFPSRRIFFFFYVMLDEHYAATLGGRNPISCFCLQCCPQSLGRPQLPALQRPPVPASWVHRETNFNYKAPSHRRHTAAL